MSLSERLSCALASWREPEGEAVASARTTDAAPASATPGAPAKTGASIDLCGDDSSVVLLSLVRSLRFHLPGATPSSDTYFSWGVPVGEDGAVFDCRAHATGTREGEVAVLVTLDDEWPDA